MLRILSILFLLSPARIFAQPSTEILLFDFHTKKNKITVSKGKNISLHKGYDNQPFLDIKKPLLYYASADSLGKTDILIYDYSSGKTSSLAKTSEREYSPTVTPDGNYISCIIQRENGAQDLGKYPISGGLPEIIVSNLTVGYHAWIDKQSLILFVLGEKSTLHRITPSAGKDTVLAEDIGRSLHRIPGEDAMSFVQKSATAPWTICKLDVKTNKITTIITALDNHEDLAWTPDGTIITSDGVMLFSFNPKKNKIWEEISIKTTEEIKGISRICVSPKGDKIAVVVEE